MYLRYWVWIPWRNLLFGRLALMHATEVDPVSLRTCLHLCSISSPRLKPRNYPEYTIVRVQTTLSKLIIPPKTLDYCTVKHCNWGWYITIFDSNTQNLIGAEWEVFLSHWYIGRSYVWFRFYDVSILSLYYILLIMCGHLLLTLVRHLRLHLFWDMSEFDLIQLTPIPALWISVHSWTNLFFVIEAKLCMLLGC